MSFDTEVGTGEEEGAHWQFSDVEVLGYSVSVHGLAGISCENAPGKK